jgi:hypothetical protein
VNSHWTWPLIRLAGALGCLAAMRSGVPAIVALPAIPLWLVATILLDPSSYEEST